VFRIVIGAILFVAALCGAGAAYNALALRHYRAAAGIPGELYDVGGYRMHLYCTGEGSPTLILDGGLGEDFRDWGKVQPALSKITKVCSYDRPGFGWSDDRPEPRDANHISSELHTLLQEAGITEPAILMGHSIAGLYIRSYAAHYPSDIAGLVFVDASTPLQFQRLPGDKIKVTLKYSIRMRREELTRLLGIDRLMGDCTDIDPGFEAYADWIKADKCHPERIALVEREREMKPQSGEETVATGPFGDLPLLVLSSDPDGPNWGDDRQSSLIWADMQEDLKKLSTIGYRIIAKGRGHELQDEASDLTNRETAAFIKQVRDHSPPAQGYGSTTIE
jgi:pimeloyl-ACP methyl ester carboxylesterase